MNIIDNFFVIVALIDSITAYMEIEITDFKQLLGQEYADWSGLRVKKINKTTRALVGVIEVKSDILDNDSKLKALISLKQGGEYRKLPYNFPPSSFCESLNNDIYMFPDIAKVSDIPSPVPCPFPQGNFTIRGFFPSLKDAPMHLFHPGDYMIQLFVIREEKQFWLVNIYGSLIKM